MSVLHEIAPRIARAIDQEKAHQMRGIHRCSCGYGWRVTAHAYDHGGCFERVESAQKARNAFERDPRMARLTYAGR